MSLYDTFLESTRYVKYLLILPKVNLDISKQNFVFSASLIWNSVIDKLLNKCSPNPNGIMIPGSSSCSDMSAPISVIKTRLKSILLNTQKTDSLGRTGEWMPINNFKL